MRPTVLVIEDDRDVRQLLVETLTDEGGFTVHAADSIREAQTVVDGCGGHLNRVQFETSS